MENKKILLATDGSMPSLVATKKAITMAKMMNATVYGVNIAEKTAVGERAVHDALSRESKAAQKAHALRIAEAYSKEQGVEFVSKKMREAPIAPSILEYAKDLNPDLIVIGNSGQEGFERVMMGSVAEDLTAHADYPVMVCKMQDAEELDDIAGIALRLGAAGDEKKGLFSRALGRGR